MKAAVVVIEYTDGKLGAVAGRAMSDCSQVIDDIRATGKHDKKVVKNASLLHTERIGVLKAYRGRTHAAPMPKRAMNTEPKPVE